MDAEQISSFSPYLRSCKQESEKPIEGEAKGEIPKWLKGCLIRVGSGLLEIGPDRFNHVFDGMSLMHRFSFQDGRVTYQNRFLRSDAYKRNTKANRIVVSEFATPAVPDPCKTIFQRFFSLFSLDEMTDNDLVNIVLYSDEAYACSETNFIWKIDPDSLESVQKVKLSQYVPVNGAIAHPHEDTDGTVYNVGSIYGLNCSFVILKFPPKESKTSNPFQNGSVVCTIPSSRYLNLSYHHSFAMTENFFVVVEQPLYMSIPRLAWSHFIAGAYTDAMHWEDGAKSRFHVVQRSSGQLLETVYLSDGFFVFHHINAYEEDNNIVVDMCCYEEGGVVKGLYVKALEEMVTNPKECSQPFVSRAKRYVLPLTSSTSKEDFPKGDNLVTLSYTKASAVQQPDGSVYCIPEILTASEPWCPELPRINYEKHNGKKYKYFYAIARKTSGERTHIIKVDTVNFSTISWSEDGIIPSEPVFISEPDHEDQEDSGIVLASLLYKGNDRKVSLLVLDAKTMQERGRVTFVTESAVPADFHGTFIPK